MSGGKGFIAESGEGKHLLRPRTIAEMKKGPFLKDAEIKNESRST